MLVIGLGIVVFILVSRSKRIQQMYITHTKLKTKHSSQSSQ